VEKTKEIHLMYSPTNILDPNNAQNLNGLEDLLVNNLNSNINKFNQLNNNVDSLLMLDQYSPPQAFDTLNQNIKQSMQQQQQSLSNQNQHQQQQQCQANVSYRRVRPEPIK
jgi:hypothetical protein